MCVRKSPPVESLYGASISSPTTVELLESEIFPVKLLFIGVTTRTQPLTRTVSFVPFIPNIEPS